MKDVIIIGGGVIGICTAWYLHQEGMEVTVIDEHDFTTGCTYGNAGMIVPSHVVPLASPGMIAKGLRWMFNRKSPFYIRPRLDGELLRWLWLFYTHANKAHVSACAPLLRDMHEEGREAFREWSAHPDFSFDFANDGILMLYNSTAGETDELAGAEHAAALGIEARQLTGDALYAMEPMLKRGDVGGVHYPGDAIMSPDKFMVQMTTWLRREGVTCLPNKKAVAVKDGGNAQCMVQCADGDLLHAKHIIVACGAWSSRLLAKQRSALPMQDGKGYSMTIEKSPGHPRIPAILHEARVAITPLGNRFRISGTLEISGMDDKVRWPKVKGIIESLPGYYNGVEFQQSDDVWYGYRPCAPDGMPYIGRLMRGSGVIIATGHAMMGLSLAPATGRMIRDLIVRNVEPPAMLQPGRF